MSEQLTESTDPAAAVLPDESPPTKAPMSEYFVGSGHQRMYVQHWRPLPSARRKKGPLVLIHGGMHTGIGWTTTPDGRPGWAFAFAAQGWDVHLVDWPGSGRSGTHPESIKTRGPDLVASLIRLLEQFDAVAVVGHSIGASLAFKVAEEVPARVKAIAAITPASVESPIEGFPPASADEWAAVTPDVARYLFANAPQFPAEAFDGYFSCVVPSPPEIFNASLGFNSDLQTRPESKSVWGARVPVLLLAAEHDQTVPVPRSQETSEALGVPLTMLGEDWGLEGHGHLCIVEHNSDAIAQRVEAWLTEATGASAND
jgi:pimeloyl-ACP methyl ester carboxylesterase